MAQLADVNRVELGEMKIRMVVQEFGELEFNNGAVDDTLNG